MISAESKGRESTREWSESLDGEDGGDALPNEWREEAVEGAGEGAILQWPFSKSSSQKSTSASDEASDPACSLGGGVRLEL